MTARKDYELIHEMYSTVQSDNQISDIYIQQFSNCLDEAYQCLNKPEYLTEGVFGAGTRLKDRASAMLSGAGQALKNVPLAAKAAVTGNTAGIKNPAHAARMTKVNNVMNRFNRDIQSLMPNISTQYPEIATQIDQLNNTITNMGQQQQTPGASTTGTSTATTGTATNTTQTGGNPNAASSGDMDGSFRSDGGNSLNIGGGTKTQNNTTDNTVTNNTTNTTDNSVGNTDNSVGDTTNNNVDNTQNPPKDPEGLPSTDDLLKTSNDKLSNSGDDSTGDDNLDVANPTFAASPTDKPSTGEPEAEAKPEGDSSPSSHNSMQSVQMLAGQLRSAKESGDTELANQIANDILNFSNSSVHGAQADNVKMAAKQVLKKYGQQQYQSLNEAIDQLLHALDTLLTETKVRRSDKWVRSSLMPGFMRK